MSQSLVSGTYTRQYAVAGVLKKMLARLLAPRAPSKPESKVDYMAAAIALRARMRKQGESSR